MRRSTSLRLALLAVAALVSLAHPGGAAVVVELFTAQGCSSCPPADRLLTAMGQDPDLQKQVVPLAFHVTYWNTKAWRDRFSDEAWTKRQRTYAVDSGGSKVYTPQLVVAGAGQCVGSDLPCIRREVEAAAAKETSRVELSVVPAGVGTLEVAVSAQLPEGVAAADVMLAVFESGLETEVKGGENANKTLRNDFVVRRLQRAFELSGKLAREERVKLRLERDWNPAKVGIAAFLQEPKSHRILGGKAVPLPPG